MRFIWTSALKDLRILRRDPFSVATWVGIPLCIGLLIQLVFGGGGARPQGLLLVADQDRSMASTLLTSSFSHPPLDKIFTVETVDPRAGRARIDRGDGSALVVIPKGLQDAILNNRPYHLQLVANAAQSILPKIVEEVLRGAVDGGFSLNLSPPLIQLETTVRNNRRNMGTADLFFPNMIFMGLLLMANGLSKDIWKECTHGTLRRLLMSPSSLAAFLTGRLAMVAMAYSAFAIAAVAAARYLAGVHVSNMAAAAAWAAVAGTVFYLFLLPLAVSSAGQRGADVRGNLLIFPLAMLGGCFFPFEVMPEWLARIGRLTPNGMAVVQFRDLLAGSVSPVHLAAVLAGLCTFGLLAFLLTLRRLRRGFLQ